ncbi:hypothetical protein MPDQ_002668 [Monascus purpureus]|uniref:NADH:ubiquinone oxidoreductase 20.1kD subunit n=1 Tax=Monascus purpureus TaxID=5098 RepID=A0A507QK39_MONPU|nr:hypothetical protein MPDQ_002668 [Monascus purpureus]BDD60505.1 hypothetical protein MAP00_005627 [Monascus purpureus]
MLPQRILARRLPLGAVHRTVPRASFSQVRALAAAEANDSLETGPYENPPPIKRSFRDPYGDWWDKQERRNFGEPVHEDNDLLGVFSVEQYTHATPGKAFAALGVFVATFLGFCGVTSLFYPDKASAPRTFPDGLEKELGGPSALRARKDGEDTW